MLGLASVDKVCRSTKLFPVDFEILSLLRTIEFPPDIRRQIVVGFLAWGHRSEMAMWLAGCCQSVPAKQLVFALLKSHEAMDGPYRDLSDI